MIDEYRWSVVEFPQPVDDDTIPWSKYYIVDDGIIVAEVLYDCCEMAFQIVKRLNAYEDMTHDR